jgi:hypothetical protein
MINSPNSDPNCIIFDLIGIPTSTNDISAGFNYRIFFKTHRASTTGNPISYYEFRAFSYNPAKRTEFVITSDNNMYFKLWMKNPCE